MDRVLRHAIDLGCDPVIALQMMTINTAQHFGLERDIGSLAPGRYADIVLTHSLDEFAADMVIANGAVVAENGQLVIDLPTYPHDGRFKRSVRIKEAVTPGHFALRADGYTNGSAVKANVIGIIENQAPTRHLTATLPITNDVVQPDLINDVIRLALVERHRGTGEIVNGFVNGFGLNVPCAVAATVAHDSHHLVVTGTSERDMALAVNRLADIGGGVIVVREGEVTALVELAIGGLMSTERADVVAAKSAGMVQAMIDCGCTLNNAYMQLSLLALVVIPELRISDMGLVDVTRFQHVPVIVQ